jgi:signal transduction histidine kinase
LNNILSSVIGFNDLSKLAADDLPDENALKEEFIYNAMQIENASKRAATLIDQMLTYCRQEVETSATVLDLKPVLEKIYGMMRGVIPKNIAIKTTLSPDIFINLDETELYQIVVNLFVNARDAIEKPQGEISLSLNLSKIVSTQRCSACEKVIQGNFVEIAVADNGSGLKAEKISRIFDPFFTTKEVGKGTGLGLSVASGIIHKAGGHIIVSSTLNQGTTFQLLFPPQKNS